jgi:alpha-galactosidase
VSLDPSERKALVLIGAGSAVFTRGLLADLISAPDLGPWELRLVDVNPEALRVTVRLAERMVAARSEQERIAVTGTTERAEALPGAHVVICSVGVGGRPAWLRDWQIAADFGVFQPVGDSVMPGGISRALRTIPVMVDVARDVAALAPDALFFNYGNPMTANVQAMSRFHEVVGLCHGLGHVHRDLAAIIGAPFEETSVLYCGLNHLTWIYDFRWNGRDAWPLLREELARQRAAGLDPGQVGRIFNEGAAWAHNPFSFSLFDVYGAYPSASDRHVTEFFPERFRGEGSYYGKTLGVDAFPLPEILEWGEERYQRMRREAEGEQALDAGTFERSSGDQEELIDILRSIMRDARRISSVNVPNTGYVPNLPAGAVLEIPGVATARGLRPLSVPDFPDTLAAIVERRLASVTLTIEAALRGDRDLAVEAMLADGAVTEPGTAAALVDRYLAEQARHLPNFAGRIPAAA